MTIQNRAGIELLLEFVGWRLFGADGPLSFRIYLIFALLLGEGRRGTE